MESYFALLAREAGEVTKFAWKMRLWKSQPVARAVGNLLDAEAWQGCLISTMRQIDAVYFRNILSAYSIPISTQT